MDELLSPETAATPEAPPEADPIRELERLRAANRRWRRAAAGAVVAFVFLFVLSLVQFLGTFITCRLLHETRQEAARNRQDTMKALGELKDARADLQKTRETAALAIEVVKARTELEKLKPRLGAIIAELAALEAREKLDILQGLPTALLNRKKELIAEVTQVHARILKLEGDINLAEMTTK